MTFYKREKSLEKWSVLCKLTKVSQLLLSPELASPDLTDEVQVMRPVIQFQLAFPNIFPHTRSAHFPAPQPWQTWLWCFLGLENCDPHWWSFIYAPLSFHCQAYSYPSSVNLPLWESHPWAPSHSTPHWFRFNLSYSFVIICLHHWSNIHQCGTSDLAGKTIMRLDPNVLKFFLKQWCHRFTFLTSIPENYWVYYHWNTTVSKCIL